MIPVLMALCLLPSTLKSVMTDGRWQLAFLQMVKKPPLATGLTLILRAVMYFMVVENIGGPLPWMGQIFYQRATGFGAAEAREVREAVEQLREGPMIKKSKLVFLADLRLAILIHVLLLILYSLFQNALFLLSSLSFPSLMIFLQRTYWTVEMLPQKIGNQSNTSKASESP